MKIIDIHTHNISSTNSLISVTPEQTELLPDLFYSVGLHPWESKTISSQHLEKLQDISAQPNVYAIGECGLDKLKGAPIETQKEIFEFHIRLSEKLCKPLIIHQVKSIDEIIFFKKKYSPVQRWLIHGFRGNPITASQLLKFGIDLSFGANFSLESLQIIPMKSLFLESDASSDFPLLLSKVANLLDKSENEISNILSENIGRFLGI